MPMPAHREIDPSLILQSMPRIISRQLFRDVLDIIHDREGTDSWEYCTSTEVRRWLFEKPAGRWAGEMLKSDEYPVNIRPKVVTEMLNILISLEWVERFGSIGLRLTTNGRTQRRKIEMDMLDVGRSLYQEKVGTDGTQT